MSPQTSSKPKCAETPMPTKTLNVITPFSKKLNEEDDENERIAQEFIRKYSNQRGARFDEDFEEINTIGRGNFGSVVKCRNKLDGIEYAIKITERSTPKNRNSIYEALQEVYALSALSVSSESQHIVRYYRGWIENAQLYIQMELCEQSLYEVFESQNLDEKEIIECLRQICIGLNELHEKGIVHLDLKLENILISSTSFRHLYHLI